MPHFTCVLAVVTLDPDEADFHCDDCDLRLEGDRLELAYFDDEGPVVFAGVAVEPGVFELVCRSRPRTASLRRLGEESVLEGSWEEGDSRGSWRVLLPPGALG